MLIAFMLIALLAEKMEITVQVYNAAGVPTSTVSRAQHDARWIFEKAGIGVRWTDCPLPQRKRGGDQICRDNGDPLLFVLWINGDDAREGAAATALGYALPFAGNGNHAAAIYPRIAALAVQHPEFIESYHLLAYVMTHEIAHLLFHSNQHGRRIMQENLTRADLKLIGQRQTVFTTEQIKEIRKRLNARLIGSPINALESRKESLQPDPPHRR